MIFFSLHQVSFNAKHLNHYRNKILLFAAIFASLDNDQRHSISTQEMILGNILLVLELGKEKNPKDPKQDKSK